MFYVCMLSIYLSIYIYIQIDREIHTHTSPQSRDPLQLRQQKDRRHPQLRSDLARIAEMLGLQAWVSRGSESKGWRSKP